MKIHILVNIIINTLNINKHSNIKHLQFVQGTHVTRTPRPRARHLVNEREVQEKYIVFVAQGHSPDPSARRIHLALRMYIHHFSFGLRRRRHLGRDGNISLPVDLTIPPFGGVVVSSSSLIVKQLPFLIHCSQQS